MHLELTTSELNAAEDRLIRKRKELEKLTLEELQEKSEELQIELDAILWRLTHPSA